MASTHCLFSLSFQYRLLITLLLPNLTALHIYLEVAFLLFIHWDTILSWMDSHVRLVPQPVAVIVNLRANLSRPWCPAVWLNSLNAAIQ